MFGRGDRENREKVESSHEPHAFQTCMIKVYKHTPAHLPISTANPISLSRFSRSQRLIPSFLPISHPYPRFSRSPRQFPSFYNSTTHGQSHLSPAPDAPALHANPILPPIPPPPHPRTTSSPTNLRKTSSDIRLIFLAV